MGARGEGGRSMRVYIRSQDLATMVIDRMPKPPRLCFTLHVGPHLIPFGFTSTTYHHLHIARRQGILQWLIHRDQYRLFF